MRDGTYRIVTLIAAVVLSLGLGSSSSALAADASCQQLFKLKSKNSNTPTTITFVNGASTVRGIMWLGFDGHPKDYANLQTGESVTLQTFLTHPWMVVTGPGDCLEIVMPVAGGSTVSLFDEGPGAGEEGEAQTSCPAGTVPVPETDNCVPAGGGEEGQAQTSCPAGTVPVPETDNCVPAGEAGGGTLPMYGRSLGGVMRSNPNMASKKIASLKEGDRIEILEDTGVTMNGYTWFKIQTGRAGPATTGAAFSALMRRSRERSRCVSRAGEVGHGTSLRKDCHPGPCARDPLDRKLSSLKIGRVLAE